MNLLPFVIIMVLVLSLFSLSQLQNSSTLLKEKKCYTGYFENLREARNTIETKAYENKLKELNKTTKGPKPPPPEGAPPPPGENPYSKNPLIINRYTVQPEGTLNLFSLLSPTPQAPQLEEVVTLYLASLYGHTDFFPKDPKFPKLFLKQLIRVQKTHTPPLPLHKIVFKDPELQEIFYKMQRGTQTCTFKPSVGYPPLSKVLTFEKGKTHLLKFDLANVLLLEILIEKEATEKLLQKESAWEEDKDMSYPKLSNTTELETHLNLRLSDQSRKRAQLVDFSRSKNPKTPNEHFDPQTNITVRID